MRSLITILFFFISLSARSAQFSKGQNSTAVEYPEVLQKAGVKKARVIFKDSRGFMWIGTENGLYRYDGSNVDLLQHDGGNKRSIPFNTIISIAEDKQGYIWAGTLEGAARVDPFNLTCVVFNKACHNLDNDFDIKIWIDADGNIWAGSSKGLSIFDKKTDRFRQVWHNTGNKEAAGTYVTCITDWKRDTLILGTFNGAVLIDKKNYHFKRIHIEKGGFTVTKLFVDSSGRTWMGTWGEGCLVYDSSLKNYIRFKWETPKKNQLANVVSDIISTNYSHDKRLWVATQMGVYNITGFTGDISACKAIPIVAEADDFVSSIYADNEQYIWIGGKSVSRFFAGSNFFTAIPASISGLTENIQTVNVNGQKDVAVSSWYGSSGLTVMTPDGSKIIYKQPDQKDQDKSNIGGVIQDKYGRLWVCTFAGLQIFDSKFQPLHSAKKLFTGNDAPLSHKAYGVFINHDTVWVECYKKGINLYDLNFHKLKTFLPGDDSGLSDNLILFFFTDSRDNVWLCGSKALFQYNKFSGKFEPYIFNRDGTTGSIQDIAELPGGDLLLASTTGLFRFNSKNGVYHKITSPLIHDNNIRSVSVDNHGDIWFINAGHLIYYEVKSHHFTLFGQEDGLNTEDDLQWLKTIDGSQFYLAESKRLVTFSPDKRQGKPKPITLYLRTVQVNDSTLSTGRFAGALYLKYNENRVNLEFGAINFIKPDQNQYAYQLIGADDKWVYTSRNYASYINIAPGKYLFKLSAENYAGIWSKPIYLPIVINPPFWKTWWFISLVIIALLACIYVIYNYRLEQLLRVERLRTRISTDLHDDIGSTLSSISILTELVLNKKNKDRADEMLNEIKDSALTLMEKMDDIVWSINPRNDSLEDMTTRITRFAVQLFEAKNIEHVIEIQPDIKELKLPMEARQHLYLIIKETINNIVKHACCNRVSISATLKDHMFTVAISDDGKGFDKEKISSGNGLMNMKERAGKMAATVQIESARMKGTTVTISIKIK